MRAAWKGHIDVVALLLDKRVDIEKKDMVRYFVRACGWVCMCLCLQSFYFPTNTCPQLTVADTTTNTISSTISESIPNPVTDTYSNSNKITISITYIYQPLTIVPILCYPYLHLVERIHSLDQSGYWGTC
jgi:hypothetical protein